MTDSLKNLILVHSYDGTSFYGWQKTKMGPSIEEALEKALQKILQEEISLNVASRTDRGVHARRQIANFLTKKDLGDPAALQRSLNALLPSEIRILEIQEKPFSFHPTLDARQKEYHYYLCLGPVQLPFHADFSWHFPYSLDLTAMQEAAKHLTGSHDFRAFTNRRDPPHQETICTLQSVEILPLQNNRLCIKIFGDHFLYKMVRNIAGTLLYIGAGKIPLQDLPRIIKNKDRTAAGITAPAHGLFLQKIYY